MDRLREQIDGMEPWQRYLLMGLLGLALLVLVAVIVVAAGNDGAPATTTTASTLVVTTPSTLPTTTTAAPTTTVGPTTTTVPETTTTTQPEQLLLRPDGLGDLTFGDRADDVLQYLTGLVGEPEEDTGWVDKGESYATCIGTQVRFVQWGALQIFLTDGPSDWAPAGVRHFAHWADTVLLGEPPIEMATEEGIGVGSTVDEIVAAYGTDARVEDDPLYGPSFILDTPGAGMLIGSLTGLQSDDTLQSLSAGFSCGE